MKHETDVSKVFIIAVQDSAKTKGAAISASKKGAKSSPAEVIAVPPHGGAGKAKKTTLPKELKEYQPVLDRLIEAKELSNAAGATCVVRFAGSLGGHLVFTQLGSDKSGIDELGAVERLRRLGASLASVLGRERISHAIVHADTFFNPAAKLGGNPAELAYGLVEGMGLACYEILNYKSAAKKESKPLQVSLVTSGAKKLGQLREGVARAEAMILGAFICRDLSNEPSNLLYPETFAQEAKKFAAKHGLTCTVLDEKALAKENMGLLLGVGQGSDKPPRLITLEYSPKGGAKGGSPKIALVGKGVTFDSGGISIKPSAKMEDMKHDMSGAAAVMGAMVALAKLKTKNRVIGVLTCAENMPSGNAINPGNILTSRSGQTVEITNTDAEGRLVLADGLDWVQDRKPQFVVDIATLTGAATVTLGRVAAVLFGNNEPFSRVVEGVAKKTGERLWKMPMYEEYFDELKSDYADMKNSGDSPSHGSAKGAYFLMKFIKEGTKWAHLDIASLAYNGGWLPYNPKRGSTGYGVRLLVEIARSV